MSTCCPFISEFSRFLLFTDGNNIRQLPLSADTNTSLRIPFENGPSTPFALDYNLQGEKVYWTDVTLDTISRAFLNGSSQETIVVISLWTCRRLVWSEHILDEQHKRYNRSCFFERTVQEDSIQQ